MLARFELLFYPGVGIRPSKKLHGGFQPRGGWSGLELTDTSGRKRSGAGSKKDSQTNSL